MNLAVNARDAMPRGGRLTLVTRGPSAAGPAGGALRGRLGQADVTLSITDTGTGMPPEVLAHVFEPFFTTKAAGRGTGLGLATVYGIVKQSGGDVLVRSEPGKGSTFTVVLPSQPPPLRRESSSTFVAGLTGGTETVLVVEDEATVRRIVRTSLEAAGYKVLEARSGPEALETARRHSGEFHLAITDVVMPEMNGREVAERLRREHPGLRVLFMSGYTDDETVRLGIVETGVAFLQKPFSPRALARKVREVLDEEPAPEAGGPAAAP
jgi:CheY-like chemotaxis protein